MTVCIAAICESMSSIVGASDRMITSGDIEFELSGTDVSRPVLKTLALSPSVAMMTAGDAGVQADIVHLICQRHPFQPAPTQITRVREFALTYSRLLIEARRRMAADRVLSPLGLDGDGFIARQKELSPAFIEDVTSGILQTRTDAEAIFAGLDDTEAHIYLVDDDGIKCCDSIGFAAIGSGARHAESQFMLANHSRNSSIVNTILLTYIAKKRSEVAPGVGEDTDLFFINRHEGFNWLIQKEHVEPLQNIYERLEASQSASFEGSKTELREWVADFVKKSQAPPPESSLPSNQRSPTSSSSDQT